MADDLQRIQSQLTSGYSPSAAARVLALHRVADFAAVWVSPDDGGSKQGEEIVFLHRLPDGTWSELSSGSATWSWTALPTEEGLDEPDEELGLLAVLGELQDPASSVLVTCRGHSVRVDSSNRHWVALFVRVTPDDMNDVQVEGAPADGSLP